MMKRIYNVYAWLAAILPLVGMTILTSCADHWDDFTPKDPTSTEEVRQELCFSASVAPSQTAQDTRADGSLINRMETSLYETKLRTYWAWDNDKKEAIRTERQYSVGVFGAYTGNADWSATASANFMFNQKMNITVPAANGSNLLTYAPAVKTEIAAKQDSVRFWPNQHDASGKYEKVSFWAYYPYNLTEDPGDYGVSIVPSDKTAGTVHYGVAEGTGMGSIRFTMHPDASEQNDFMMSELMPDCSRNQYPLNGTTPTPVPLRFHHMLAQVRLYAFLRGKDKVVYAKDGDNTLVVETVVKNEAGVVTSITLKDGNTYTVETSGMNDFTSKYVNEWGVTKELMKGDSIPDDTPWLKSVGIVSEPKTIRWQRNSDIIDVSGEHVRANITYKMSFNNIHTEAVFTPTYTYDASTGKGKTTFSCQEVGTLGSATVNHYIMNPYWFRFKDGERVMLNENYMYDYFETTPAAKGLESDGNYDGFDWSTKSPNYLKYDIDDEGTGYAKEIKDPDYEKGTTLPRYKGINTNETETLHFNYAPGNILLCVPQVMNDNDVPHIVLEGLSKQVTYAWNGTEYEGTPTDTEIVGKVTINMLNMNLKWESGFIYCYAFVDELQPGDDKVRGPESITSVFDPSRQTDQW